MDRVFDTNWLINTRGHLVFSTLDMFLFFSLFCLVSDCVRWGSRYFDGLRASRRYIRALGSESNQMDQSTPGSEVDKNIYNI